MPLICFSTPRGNKLGELTRGNTNRVEHPNVGQLVALAERVHRRGAHAELGGYLPHREEPFLASVKDAQGRGPLQQI